MITKDQYIDALIELGSSLGEEHPASQRDFYLRTYGDIIRTALRAQIEAPADDEVSRAISMSLSSQDRC